MRPKGVVGVRRELGKELHRLNPIGPWRPKDGPFVPLENARSNVMEVTCYRSREQRGAQGKERDIHGCRVGERQSKRGDSL